MKTIGLLTLLFLCVVAGFSQDGYYPVEKDTYRTPQVTAPQMTRIIAKAEWVLAAHNASGDPVYINKSEKIKVGEVLLMIVKIPISGAIIYERFSGNCVHNTIIESSRFVVYPEKSAMIKLSFAEDNVIYIARPTSTAYRLLDFACNNTKDIAIGTKQ